MSADDDQPHGEDVEPVWKQYVERLAEVSGAKVYHLLAPYRAGQGWAAWTLCGMRASLSESHGGTWRMRRRNVMCAKCAKAGTRS
jgi:peptide methionine sulfoxide reductase MsrB